MHVSVSRPPTRQGRGALCPQKKICEDATPQASPMFPRPLVMFATCCNCLAVMQIALPQLMQNALPATPMRRPHHCARLPSWLISHLKKMAFRMYISSYQCPALVTRI